MKSEDDFIDLVDGKFYSHILNKSLLPFDFKVKPKKKDFLRNVYSNLIARFLNYKPKSPRKYISTPKDTYVIRMVPTFELADYCIYYFCLKVLEDQIAENRVENTFGGWRLGGRIREQEEFEFEMDFEDSVNENSFNQFAWRQEFGAFQAKLKESALKIQDKTFKYALKFDIANFYDNIRLDILNKKIKERIGNDDFDDEIYLLFRFLTYWNSKYDNSKSVGIPQDEVGDCSRILANFYLQDYDQFIFDRCNEHGAIYLRYADDQIIFTNKKEDINDLLYLASEKLFEIGLNINCSKLKYFDSYEDFDEYYSFKIFEKLQEEDPDLEEVIEDYFKKVDSKVAFRHGSVLKRLLKFDLQSIDDGKRLKLISHLWNEHFLLHADIHYFEKIYHNLKNEDEQKNFLKTLKEIEEKTKFESYKLHLNKFRLCLSTTTRSAKKIYTTPKAASHIKSAVQK